MWAGYKSYWRTVPRGTVIRHTVIPDFFSYTDLSPFVWDEAVSTGVLIG